METKLFYTPDHWLGREISVVLIGCGGTGSEMLDCLARLDWVIRALGHPGLRVKVYDGDTVEAPNVGRSQFYPADVGFNKAIVSVQRANLRWGACLGMAFPSISSLPRNSLAGTVSGRSIYLSPASIKRNSAPILPSYAGAGAFIIAGMPCFSTPATEAPPAK